MWRCFIPRKNRKLYKHHQQQKTPCTDTGDNSTPYVGTIFGTGTTRLQNGNIDKEVQSLDEEQIVWMIQNNQVHTPRNIVESLYKSHMSILRLLDTMAPWIDTIDCLPIWRNKS